jgi:hypothetical protein
MHTIGANILETLLNADGGGYRGAVILREQGHFAQFVDYREKKLLTVLGDVTVKRAYYHDKESHCGFCPKVTYGQLKRLMNLRRVFTKRQNGVE